MLIRPNQGIISKLFDGIDEGSLSWQEKSRRDLRTKWRIPAGEPIPEWRLERIEVDPSELLDEFCYSLELLNGGISYVQRVSDTTPAYNSWSLYFHFGKSQNPTEPGSALISPVFLDTKLMFERSDYLHFITLMEQNLRMVDDGWGRREFTEGGKRIMDDLIDNISDIKSVRGLRDSEHFNLKVLLETIKSQYESGELEPNHWNYGV